MLHVLELRHSLCGTQDATIHLLPVDCLTCDFGMSSSCGVGEHQSILLSQTMHLAFNVFWSQLLTAATHFCAISQLCSNMCQTKLKMQAAGAFRVLQKASAGTMKQNSIFLHRNLRCLHEGRTAQNLMQKIVTRSVTGNKCQKGKAFGVSRIQTG